MSYLGLAFLLAVAPPAGARHVADEILVRFAPGVAEADARRTLDGLGARETDRLPEIMVRRVKLPPGQTVEAAIDRLGRNPNVLYAEPNLVLRAKGFPTDTYFPIQWSLDRISASQCWGSSIPGSTGSAAITIAIVDTGIQSAHPDFAGKLVTGTNILSPGSAPEDDNGHGTGVASVAAAASNNKAGITGVAWDAMLMAVKVLDATGQGTEFDIDKGVLWAARHGARVINMSLGSCDPVTLVCDPGTSSGAATMQQAWSLGCVLVAATGNEGTTNTSFPAGYPHVLGVGATDRNDQLTAYSNRGTAMDVVAPGGTGVSSCNSDYDMTVAILTSQVCDNFAFPAGWGTEAGTSFAAPMVSGLAAVLLGVNPAGTPDSIVSLIEQTADPAGGVTGWTPGYGYGRINMYRALTGQAAPPPATGTPAWVYPNPFSPLLQRHTTFVIPAGAGQPISIEIRDVTGTLVWTKALSAAETSGLDLYYNSPLRWDGNDTKGRQLANGVYVARIRVGSTTCVKRIVVAR
ncbi:MAG: S8 family serine peptidase [Candidatus Coatesbacteria bacterium]